MNSLIKIIVSVMKSDPKMKDKTGNKKGKERETGSKKGKEEGGERCEEVTVE